MNLPYDPLLRNCMNRVGLTSWKALQEKAGIGQKSLIRLRRGELERLNLAQLRAIATALNWNLATLLQQFGVLEGGSEDRERESLRQEGQRLKQQLADQSQRLTKELQTQVFQQLQSLLTNYPSVSRMSQAKPDLPAKTLVSLFTPLENLTRSWGYEPIGSVWEQVPYDPQWHQPDVADLAVGEPVYVRFVGYRQGDRILCPAKVSRTLPGGLP
uniref:HTH cro/C1-type domain-containing protein n=1 Tax=Cyanothece sp. (strain PCC 7425 / ATCC 29141) TaxID=395961 RepID=B8HXB1_CYAP4